MPPAALAPAVCCAVVMMFMSDDCRATRLEGVGLARQAAVLHLHTSCRLGDSGGLALLLTRCIELLCCHEHCRPCITWNGCGVAAVLPLLQYVIAVSKRAVCCHVHIVLTHAHRAAALLSASPQSVCCGVQLHGLSKRFALWCCDGLAL